MQQPTNSRASVSHFDFDRVDIQTENHTSTLKDLLGEIWSADTERNEDGQQIGISSLARTLAFLGQLTGRSYTNINEELPYSLLKTVKLLYLCSRDGENHIFEYLELPDPERNRPTFEFRLSGQAPRNETNMGIVLRLISELEKGIGDERRDQIRGVILTYSKLLDCIRIENDEILAPIRALPPELHASLS